MAEEDEGRTLGWAPAVALVTGAILGTSAFVAPSLVAVRVTTAPLDVLAWVVAGALAILGAATFAELGTLLPLRGGPYVFLREALGPMAGGLAGWALLVVVRTAALAALALVAGGYVAALLPTEILTGPAMPALGVLLLVATSVVNLGSTRVATRVQMALASLALVGALVLVVMGLLAPAAAPGAATSTSSPGPLSGLLLALVPALLALGGWSVLTEVGGDLRDPGRLVPAVLVGSVAAATFVLLLLNLVAMRALGVAGLAASALPAADAARAGVRALGTTVAIATVLVATVAAMNALLFGAGRVVRAMGDDGAMAPGFVGSPGSHLPFRGVLLPAVLAGACAAVPGAGTLLVAAAAPVAWALLAAVAVSLVVLRVRRPDAPRPYRVGAYPLVPAIFAVATTLAAIWTAISRPGAALLGVALVALGVPVLRWWRGETLVPSWLDVRSQPSAANGTEAESTALEASEQELLAYLRDLRHHGATFHAREAAKALGASERAIYEGLAGLREKRPSDVRIGFWDGSLHVRASPKTDDERSGDDPLGSEV